MPNKKKKYSARFPPARIKKIMQKDDEVGKVAAAVPVIISRSLELFVESLIKKTNNLVVSRNARTLTPQHIKQTVLVESEFKFLHELVSAIPDVQSTEDEQPSSHLAHQTHVQDTSVAATTITDRALSISTNPTVSTTSSMKPPGKQRGRPRKIKTDEVKLIKAKKPKLAPNVVGDQDSEETCSGSEEENKELINQSKIGCKASSGQKPGQAKEVQFLPSYSTNCTVLPSTIVFNQSVPGSGSTNQPLASEAYQTLELPIPSKVVEAFMTLNGGSSFSSATGQQIPEARQAVSLAATTAAAAAAASNEEALDLSTSGGKNGDARIKREGLDVEALHQNIQNKTMSVPRTFFMTNIQTLSPPTLGESPANKPPTLGEAYKLNIPKISVQPGSPLIKTDLVQPSIPVQGSRPSLSQSLPNYDLAQGQSINQVIRPLGASPAIAYQIQNLAQKSQPTQIIFSQLRPELDQNLPAAEGQFSPVRLLQYPTRFVSLLPGASLGSLKSPASSTQSAASAAPTNEDQKATVQSENDSAAKGSS